MKRFLIGLVCIVAVATVAMGLVAANYAPTIRPNTVVGMVDVGGLTPDEAARKLRVWWETERQRPLRLSHPALREPIAPMTPGRLGIALDDKASIANLPQTAFWSDASDRITGAEPERQTFPVQFKAVPGAVGSVREIVERQAGNPAPARAEWKNGTVVRTPERVGLTLDEGKLGEAVIAALRGDGTVLLPLIEAPKRVADAELDKIVEVVSEFSTRFPAYQVSRNTNIRLAAERLDGTVLMPGERLSFNERVGKRTAAAGFREAPVFVQGRHDTGIGGGICQVSTTMYNAALFANLKVVRRQNHSLPVAYVPVGRDAAVDYGSIDLVFENSYDQPIAICSVFERGRLTFRILGRKVPGQTVRITTANHRSWSRGQKTVVDATLAPGARRVVDKGGSAHIIDTFREVYIEGRLVKREPLGRSNYRGGPRIIAVGPARPASVGAASGPIAGGVEAGSPEQEAPLEPAPSGQGW